MTALADSKVWQDVYRVPVVATAVGDDGDAAKVIVAYVKFTTDPDGSYFIISFKETSPSS